MFVNTGYEILCIAFLSSTLAQILKFIGFLIINRKINFKCLTTTGGMPSAHSAAVVSMATVVGLIVGFDSIEFAIAAVFAIVVMYDAAGVRRAAGKMAAVLNKMKDDFYEHNAVAAGERLKELLGHTPFEVFAGALLGVVCALGFHILMLTHYVG